MTSWPKRKMLSSYTVNDSLNNKYNPLFRESILIRIHIYVYIILKWIKFCMGILKKILTEDINTNEFQLPIKS